MKTPLPILCVGLTPAFQRCLRFEDWQAATDVIRTQDVHISVGGKATNALRAITIAGGIGSLLSVSGGNVGKAMQRSLRDEGLEAQWVEVEGETRMCQTLTDSHQGHVRELVEEAAALKNGEWGEVFSRLEQALLMHALVCFSGSLPREAPPEALATLAGICVEHGKAFVVDAVGPALLATLPHQPLLVKINRSELTKTTGSEDLKEGCNQLLSAGATSVFITDGPHPAHYFSKRDRFTLTLPAIEARHPVGGGDTATGVTALRLLTGDKPKAACKAGLAAAMAQSEHPLPARFDLERAGELERFIK